MSIKPDWWIRERALEGMIEPFSDRLVRSVDNAGVISYGLSSFGYDLRCAREFKIFVNAFNTVVDPKHFDASSFVDFVGDTVIIPPNSFVLARSVEYLRIPDNVMVVALGKSTYARCFSNDTRVALVDGSAPTLEEMAARAEGGEAFFGYALGEHGQIQVCLLEAPRRVGTDRLLEIVLDNGETVRATPDHRFILRDGRSAEACQLWPGTALMPLYRRVHRGYEMTYQPLTGYLYPTHRMADEWNLRHGIYPALEGTHRHHLDLDRRNNNPWNLERMNASEHLRLHNAHSYRSLKLGGEFDPLEHSLSIREALERLRQDDVRYRSYRAQQQQKATDFWNAPRFEVARARLLERHRARWTPLERLKQQERIRAAYQDPALRAQIAERSRSAWAEDAGGRRTRQREIARQIRLRPEIDATAVLEALNQTGSIRGAARLLECDRSTFRRFPEVLATFRGRGAPPQEVLNHKVMAVRELPGEHDVYCLTVPEAGNFALEAGVFVHNCGVVANVTPLEPGWEGHVTLEFSNTTPLPAKMYANEGCVQLLFFEGERPEVTYRDRGGKYQGQTGVTLPKL